MGDFKDFYTALTGCNGTISSTVVNQLVEPSFISIGSDIPLTQINNLRPKRIIFNPPATIVYWEDETKTVVKTANQFKDEFDKETGLAMAYMRKIYGSRSAFLKIIKSAERNGDA